MDTKKGKLIFLDLYFSFQIFQIKFLCEKVKEDEVGKILTNSKV